MLSKECGTNERGGKKFFSLPLERKKQCHVDSQIGYVGEDGKRLGVFGKDKASHNLILSNP